MKIGEALKRLMQEKGTTPAAVAKELGVNRSTVFRILSDDANPTVKTLSQIADVLEIKLSEIFIEAEKQKYKG